jgi:cell division septation protein DedD
MERKTKYRTLGILVIIAVVIVLLPFVSRRNEFASDTVAIKAPPFPSQTINMSSGLEDVSSEVPPQPDVQQEAAAAKVDKGVQLETDDVISTTHPSIINEVEVPDINAPKHRENTKRDVSEVRFVQNEVPIKRNSLAESNHIKNSTHQISKLANNSMVDFKNILWVVQLGSFKNKKNALRLVNQLRANGYHAFIQKMSNDTLGEHTRVFVGPANKKTDANILAMRLENDIHIRGIIISYKPLSL